MDLSKIDIVEKAAEGAVMELLHPTTGQPLMTDEDPPQKMTITLLGMDSKEAVKFQHKTANHRLGRRRRGVATLSSEELDADTVRLLAKLTVAWHIQVEGQILEMSLEKVEEVYERFPWIREQVDLFINDRKNFLGN